MNIVLAVLLRAPWVRSVCCLPPRRLLTPGVLVLAVTTLGLSSGRLSGADRSLRVSINCEALAASNRIVLSWSATPGNHYVVKSVEVLSQPWQNLPPAPLVAQSNTLTFLELNDRAMRFYQVVELSALEAGMMLVPPGPFAMGNTFSNETTYAPEEIPVHTVYVSAFYMDRHEVTKALWDSLYSWAVTNGYVFEQNGTGKATNHPVVGVSWHDVLKWCNARSEKDGLTPVYYTDLGHTAVYRSGRFDLDVNYVKRTANGFRLPTEAEWEKAARGGASGRRFPWGDIISRDDANYYSYWQNGAPYFPYDASVTEGFHPAFNDGVYPLTGPVGSFATNGFGLYDLGGNVWEWCWDSYDGTWYTQPGATESDTWGPVGENPQQARVMRGGSWWTWPTYARCSSRFSWPYWDRNIDLGFRCARNL